MTLSLAEIPNRESLERDLSAQMEGGKTVSVVFVDLDGFKQVNDQHGHDEGNRCLVEVSAAMSTVIDGKGRLYRVGGDEFCIMLPHASGSEATAAAEQMRLAIDRLKPFGGTSRVTASIGVATSCEKLTDVSALIAAADEVMYVSKWTTKNCVTTWPPTDAARLRADVAKLHDRMGSVQREVQGLHAQIAAEERRNEQERQRRQKTVGDLAKLLDQGLAIRGNVEYNNFSGREVSNWKQLVTQYLTENLGESFAVRFRSASHQIPQYPPSMVPGMRVPWAQVTEGMMALEDFMAEFRVAFFS